jgi:uncharacterized membrane protein
MGAEEDNLINESNAPEHYDAEEIQNIVKAQLIEQHYQGPIPSGDEIIKYGSFDPSLPIRIIEMAEKNQDARIKWEKRYELKLFSAQTDRANFKDSAKLISRQQGMIYSFLIMILLIGSYLI